MMINPFETNQTEFSAKPVAKQGKTTKKNRTSKSVARTHKKELPFTNYKSLRARAIAKKSPNNEQATSNRLTKARISAEVMARTTYSETLFCKEFHDSFYDTKLLEFYNELIGINYQIIRYLNTATTNIFDILQITDTIVVLSNIKLKIESLISNLDNTNIDFANNMLSYINSRLYNCYDAIFDDINQRIIIKQIKDQNYDKYVGLTCFLNIKDVSNFFNLGKLDFVSIIESFNQLKLQAPSISKKKIDPTIEVTPSYSSGTHQDHKEYMKYLATAFEFIIDKTPIEDKRFCVDGPSYNKLFYVVDLFISNQSKDFTSQLESIKRGLNLYYDYIDNPEYKAINDVILSTNGHDFTLKLQMIVSTYCRKFQINNCKLHEANNKITTSSKNQIAESIKALFNEYSIKINNLDNWLDNFLDKKVDIVFTFLPDFILGLVEWMTECNKIGVNSKPDYNKRAKVKKALAEIGNDYTKFATDEKDWAEIPDIVLKFFFQSAAVCSIKYSFGINNYSKNNMLAMFYAKIVQTFTPFLGTTLIAINNRNDHDALLCDLDTLDYISIPENNSYYKISCKYLIAQIADYLIDNSKTLAKDQKNILFERAKAKYLEIAAAGNHEAYLKLADMIAKTANSEQDLAKAADIYEDASFYCKILCDTDGVSADLQASAMISMNIFSIEANLLRSMLADQPVTTAKNSTKKNKSKTKTAAVASKPKLNQNLAKEITDEELTNWYQSQQPKSRSPSRSAPKIKKNSTSKDVATPLARTVTLEEENRFWLNLKKAITAINDNSEAAFELLLTLPQEFFFKQLEHSYKNDLTIENGWIIIFVYQQMIYYHFLQKKLITETNNNTSYKSFYGGYKKNFSEENCTSEAKFLIAHCLKLIFGINHLETDSLMEFVLNLNNYGDLPQKIKTQLASVISSYGHLQSLDDHKYKLIGKNRTAGKLFDKADEVNPYRLVKKRLQQENIFS